MSTQDTTLPPLPRAAVDEHNLQGGRLLYTRDQMREYARAAIAAQAPQAMVKVRFRRAHCEDEIIIPATDDPKKHVEESLILGVFPVEHQQAQQAQGVPDDERKRVINLAKQVGLIGWVSEDYEHFVFSEEQPLSAKLVELVLAAAPQAEPQPEREPMTNEQVHEMYLEMSEKITELDSPSEMFAEIVRDVEHALGIGTKGD